MHNGKPDIDELAHYGVPGMKWGVRKDRESRKGLKFKTYMDKTTKKGAKLEAHREAGDTSSRQARRTKRYLNRLDIHRAYGEHFGTHYASKANEATYKGKTKKAAKLSQKAKNNRRVASSARAEINRVVKNAKQQKMSVVTSPRKYPMITTGGYQVANLLGGSVGIGAYILTRPREPGTKYKVTARK